MQNKQIYFLHVYCNLQTINITILSREKKAQTRMDKHESWENLQNYRGLEEIFRLLI